MWRSIRSNMILDVLDAVSSRGAFNQERLSRRQASNAGAAVRSGLECVTKNMDTASNEKPQLKPKRATRAAAFKKHRFRIAELERQIKGMNKLIAATICMVPNQEVDFSYRFENMEIREMSGTFASKCFQLHVIAATYIGMKYRMCLSMLKEESQSLGEADRWSGILHRRLSEVLKELGYSKKE